jgi:hypothetical protein
VNRVLEDLALALRPRRIAVRGVFTPRGGIQTTVEARAPRGPAGEITSAGPSGGPSRAPSSRRPRSAGRRSAR